MPSFVPPEASSFSVESGKALARLVGLTVDNRGGWSVFPRATLVVFDGPEDEGFLLRRLDASGIDRAPSDWDDAVQHHGGAWLLVDDGEGIFAGLVA